MVCCAWARISRRMILCCCGAGVRREAKSKTRGTNEHCQGKLQDGQRGQHSVIKAASRWAEKEGKNWRSAERRLAALQSAAPPDAHSKPAATCLPSRASPAMPRKLTSAGARSASATSAAPGQQRQLKSASWTGSTPLLRGRPSLAAAPTARPALGCPPLCASQTPVCPRGAPLAPRARRGGCG